MEAEDLDNGDKVLAKAAALNLYIPLGRKLCGRSSAMARGNDNDLDFARFLNKVPLAAFGRR